MAIKLSDSAAGKVKELLTREAPEQNGLALRVAVQPGGGAPGVKLSKLTV